MSARTAQDVNWQQMANAYRVGDLVNLLGDDVPQGVGRVVAVWPAIGMVDVLWPSGWDRKPVEELIRLDDSTPYVPPTADAGAIPGGVKKVPVSGGKKASRVAGSKFSPGDKVVVKSTHGYAPYRGQQGVIDKYVPFGKYYVQLKKERVLVDQDQLDKQASVSVQRVAQAFEKKSLYWKERDRQYCPSREEKDSGIYKCPKCCEDMSWTRYKRRSGKSERLLACRSCLFLIKPADAGLED